MMRFDVWKEEENKEEWEKGSLMEVLLLSCGLQHKYQINVDGTVAAYRLPYLLVGDSVVLKQDSIYYEHFYNELQPWKHYIPVKSNLSDLLEKLQWAKDHDEEVRSVSFQISQGHFHVLCLESIQDAYMETLSCKWEATSACIAQIPSG